MGKKIVILVILFSVLLLSACGIKVDGIPNQKHTNLIAGDFYVAILDGSGNLQIGYMANCEYEKERFHLQEYLLDAAQEGNLAGFLDAGNCAVGIRKNGTLAFRPEDWNDYIKNLLENSCVGIEVDLLQERLEETASWENIRTAYGRFPNEVMGILEDGTAISSGLYRVYWNDTDMESVESWTNLTEIAMAYSGFQVVALRDNGDVYQIRVPEAENWHNIKMLATTGSSIYALTNSGDVLSNTEMDLNHMKNITFLAGGQTKTDGIYLEDLILGICQDGTVIDQNGNEWVEFFDCVMLSISNTGIIAGIKKDGTVIVGGSADKTLQNWAGTIHCNWE